MTTQVWYGGRVRAESRHGATAIAARDGVIAWIGDDDGVESLGAETAVDLRGATVMPAFVDGHVHTTQTGMTLTGLDLHGVPSRDTLLDRVADFARHHPGDVVIGTGWDETLWDDSKLPSPNELDRAFGSGLGYLSRIDVHSALASPALLTKAGVAPDSPDVDGARVQLDAHHVVRKLAFDTLPTSQLRAAQARARQHAASLGIAALHEMNGPKAAGERDLASLLALCTDEPGVDIAAYWGELGDVETPLRHGIVGAGGDLFCDGSVGSHTAAVSKPYTDATGEHGVLRYQRDEIADHIVRAARAGLQSGFHVIGDVAIDTVLAAYEQVARELGSDVIRRGRHRLEHVELLSPVSLRRMAALGLTASVQPAFDAYWGGAAQMYAQRLGAERALAMNPFAAMHAAGIPLAFGSDSPITPLDPWGGVWAAVGHHEAAHRLTPEVAFAAATVAGHRAVGDDVTGPLRVGAPATFAAWDSENTEWTADGLPAPDSSPTCVATVVRGRTVYYAAHAAIST